MNRLALTSALLLSALSQVSGCSSEGAAPEEEPIGSGDGNGSGGEGAVATGGADVGATGGVDGATGGSSAGDTGGGSSGGSDTGGATTGGSASGGDAGTGGGTPVDPCAGLTLCDDFEDAAIDESLWSVETSDGNSMTLTSDHAAHGTQSLYLSVNNGYARLRNESAFPMPNNDYFGRMYLRVDQFSTVAWAHWTIGEGAGNGDGSLIRVGGQYNTAIGANRWGVGSDGGPTGDWTDHDQDPAGSPQEPPEDTWVCVEWEHRGSENVTRFFVDGTEHPSLATTANDHGGNNVPYVLPDMTSFWFGWWQYQQDHVITPYSVWIDLVAIDDERIGCLP